MGKQRKSTFEHNSGASFQVPGPGLTSDAEKGRASSLGG